MLGAAVLPTYTNNIPRTLLVFGALCAAAAADKIVTIQPILVVCATFRYTLIGLSMKIFFQALNDQTTLFFAPKNTKAHS